MSDINIDVIFDNYKINDSVIYLDRIEAGNCYHSTIPSDGATYELWLCRKDSKRSGRAVTKVSGAGISVDGECIKYYEDKNLAATSRPKVTCVELTRHTGIDNIFRELYKMRKIKIDNDRSGNMKFYMAGKSGYGWVIKNQSLPERFYKSYGKLYLCLFRNGIPVSNLLRYRYQNY